MAQNNFEIRYKLTKIIKAGTRMSSADILALVADAQVIQMRNEKSRIGINGGEAVTFKYGDIGVVVNGDTWMFIEDAEVAIGVVVNLLP